MIAFALLNLADLLTTWAAGTCYEMNPATRRLLAQYGLWGFAVSKVLLVAYFTGTATLMRRLGFRVLLRYYRAIMIGIYAVTVAWNVRYLLLV